MPRNYLLKTTPAFRKALRKLSSGQKASARKAFSLFKSVPFDAQLQTHKIDGLSAKLGRTIYSVRIESDLRAIFNIESELVVSLDIGDHAIYRK